MFFFSILQGIPPRGQYDNPLRQKIADINSSVAKHVTDMLNVCFFDVDPALFISPVDGTISNHDLYDYLHFTRQGYRKLAEPLLEEIQTIIKNFLAADAQYASEAEN